MFKWSIFLLIFCHQLLAKDPVILCTELNLTNLSPLSSYSGDQLSTLASSIVLQGIDDSIKNKSLHMVGNALRFLVNASLSGPDKALLWELMAEIIEQESKLWGSRRVTPTNDNVFIFKGISIVDAPLQVLVIDSEGNLYRGEGEKTYARQKVPNAHYIYVPQYQYLRKLERK